MVNISSQNLIDIKSILIPIAANASKLIMENLNAKMEIKNDGTPVTLADKKADIYPRFGPTSEWDIAAADAVLRSRGGGIFQIDNQKPFPSKKSLF